MRYSVASVVCTHALTRAAFVVPLGVALAMASLPAACKRKVVCESGASTQVVGGALVSQPEGDDAGKRTVALSIVGGICTGVVVAADAILSARHCVDGKVARGVHFGTDARAPLHRRSVTSTSYHPTEDLSVVRFSGGIPPGFVATRIADARTPLAPGDSLLVAGFGVNDIQYRTRFGTLFRAEVPFLETRSMPGRVKWGQNGSAGMTQNPFILSDGRMGKGVCMGDSGGPAFVRVGGKLLVVALTQGGQGQGACGSEVNFHTDLRLLQEWVAGRVTLDEALFEESPARTTVAASMSRGAADSQGMAVAPTPGAGDAASDDGCQ